MNPLSAVVRRACVPVLAVGLVSMGLATPTAFAEEVTPLPAQADVRTSEAEAAAEAIATNKDVVVDAATTPTAMTVATPDGTLTTTISNEPVRMQTSEGWIDISTDLVPATVDGVAVLKPQNVPVDITVGAGGSNKIASLDDQKPASQTPEMKRIPLLESFGRLGKARAFTVLDLRPGHRLRLPGRPG